MLNCTFGDSNCTFGDSNCTFGDSNCSFGDLNCTFGDSNCTFGDSNCTSGRLKCASGRLYCTSGRLNCTDLFATGFLLKRPNWLSKTLKSWDWKSPFFFFVCAELGFEELVLELKLVDSIN